MRNGNNWKPLAIAIIVAAVIIGISINFNGWILLAGFLGVLAIDELDWRDCYDDKSRMVRKTRVFS